MASTNTLYPDDRFIVKGLARGDIDWLTELSGMSRQNVVNILKGEYNTKRIHEYVLFLAAELGRLRIEYAKKLSADFAHIVADAETIKQPVSIQ